MASYVDEQFSPVRVHVREQADVFKRLGAEYDAHWTPTILILDAEGVERHRIEGFLPVDEFLPQLALGRAKAAFAQGEYERAERQFSDIANRFSQSEAAAEALYWTGVSRYKASGDAAALKDTAQQFRNRYTDTVWAKKASVWQ